MNQLTNLKSLILIPLALACFSLPPTAQAFEFPDGFFERGNTAEGGSALLVTIGGSAGYGNTAMGQFALSDNAQGAAPGDRGSFNTAIGVTALLINQTGSNNIAEGWYAGRNLTSGDSNIYIGNEGVDGESSTIRIGSQTGIPSPLDGLLFAPQTRAFIAGISGTPVNGVPVKIDSSGQLGVPASSERFKDEIKPMSEASEAILALKPVTFRYKKGIDPDRTRQFGLVAEQVERVNRDLVVRDANGKPFTVRYDAVNAMLLNEFLKEHRKVQEQEVTIAQLKKNFQSQLAQQQKQIEALTAGLQKVSDKVEMTKPAPQVARNDQ
jgi:hypothetical protein